MKYKYLFTIILLIQSIFIFSQENTKEWYLKVGGSYSNFQDVKFSNVRFNGTGFNYSIGYQKQTENSLWGVNLQSTVSNEKPSTHNATKVNVSSTILNVMYLHQTSKNIHVGATWSVFDFYSRSVEGLGNNGQNELSSSTLWATANYNYKKIKFGLDLGLLSFVKDNSSFTYSAPQEILEEGAFNLQDEDIYSRFSFKGYKLRSLSKNFQIRTSINYELSLRFNIGYNWQMRKYSEIKNFPKTNSIHSLSLRYNFIKRTSK